MDRLYHLGEKARNDRSAAESFISSKDVLGLQGFENPLIKMAESQLDRGSIDILVSSRLAARAAKDWKESDRIRDELDAMGVSIKDNKDGTTSWEVKR